MTDEGVHILVVEDDAGMRTMIADILQDEDYHVETASGGEEAVRKAAARTFDLVIADVRMPDMDGLEALARVKQQTPNVGSLVVTGYFSEAESLRALRLGVGDFLRKPFDLKEFLGAVRKQLEQRAAEVRRIRTERGLRSLALWASHALARVLDERDDGVPLQAAEIAGLLAPQLEVDAHDVQLATLVRALGDRLGAPFDASMAPPTMQRMLAPQDVSLQSRVVDLAIAAAAASDAPLRPALAALHPDRFEPFLLEALDRALQAETRAPERAESSARGLLSLGRTFEDVGNREGAATAFQQVVATFGGTREAVEGYVGLARLAAPADAQRKLEEAVALARRLGPASLGSALLEGGLLLRDTPFGQDLLREAAAVYRETRLMPGLALSRLALAGPDEDVHELLNILCSAEYVDVLAGAASLLVPLAASRGSRALRFFVRECPRQVARSVAGAHLDADGRLAVIAACKAEGLSPLLVVGNLADDEDERVRRALAQDGSEPAEVRPARLRIRSLGSFEVFVGDRRITQWRRQKVKYLLAYLAGQHGRSVVEDQIMEMFWPHDAEKAKFSLYSATSSLRRLLCPEGLRVDYVVRRLGLLCLNPDLPRWHDLEELETCGLEAAALWATGRRDEALDRYRRMAQLYTGPYLDGCFMEWALEYRTRLERKMVEVFCTLAEAAVQGGRPHEATEHASRALELDPLCQEACLVSMRASMDMGAAQDAIRTYERCRKVLDAELGVEPSIPLVEACMRARLSLGSGDGPHA